MNRLLGNRSDVDIGGSELLMAFLDEALRIRADRLDVLVPYVTDGIFADNPFRRAWTRLLCHAQTTVVVRTQTAAEALLHARRANLAGNRLLINPRLHAKVFLASKGTVSVALAGSQNLTAAALHDNHEVGVLIRPYAPNARAMSTAALQAIIERIVRESTAYMPSRSLSSSHPSSTAAAARAERISASRKPLNSPNSSLPTPFDVGMPHATDTSEHTQSRIFE
jgi:phosphatidylserine/phosphatidylglycerophosphate/cardiolipin synthase-like enzyme